MGKDKKDKPEPLPTGSVSVASLQDELQVPERKGLYQWEEIGKSIENGDAYVLPLTAKKNSILTGIRREKIQGKIAQHKVTGQLVIVPVKD